jgi:hypothetical protein
MKKYVALSIAMQTALVVAWSGEDKKIDQSLDFYGVLISRQDHVEKVNNIRIGRDRDSAKTHKISMYEKPTSAPQIGPKGEMMLQADPKTDLIESFIDLSEITSIAVPNPKAVWHYKPSKSSFSIEYIEIVIMFKNGDTKNYLLELGREDSRNPIKVFCSSVHESKATATTTFLQKESPLFCKGIRTNELEDKGVPFAAIKELKIEGPCHRAPQIAPQS